MPRPPRAVALPVVVAALIALLGSVAAFAILVALLRPGHVSPEYLAIIASSFVCRT